MQLSLHAVVAFFRRPLAVGAAVVGTVGSFIGLTVDVTPEETAIYYQNLARYEPNQLTLFIGNGSERRISESQAYLYDHHRRLVKELGSLDTLNPNSAQYFYYDVDPSYDLADKLLLCVQHNGDYIIDNVTTVFPLREVAGSSPRYEISDLIQKERWIFSKGTCDKAVRAS